MHLLKKRAAGCAMILCLFTSAVLAFDCAPWRYPEQQQSDEISKAVEDHFKHGLLWEIRSRAGARSYIFGTIHLSDPGVLSAARFAEQYVAAMKNFAMEVLITPDTARFSVNRMFYTDERRLSDLLPPALFEQTTQLLFEHGVTSQAADKLKPWAAYITLAVPPTDAGIPLDLRLLNIAENAGNQLYGIETIEEQLGVFEQLQLQTQISLLAESVCNYAENQAQVETMVALYKAQDLRGLMAVGEQYQTASNRRLLERLLFRRNQIIAARIVPWLHRGDFFIAIGALHLPGTRGLLHKLASSGFELRAVGIMP